MPEPWPIACPACASGRRHAAAEKVHHPLLGDWILTQEEKVYGPVPPAPPRQPRDGKKLAGGPDA
jgi:hypothetical protein